MLVYLRRIVLLPVLVAFVARPAIAHRTFDMKKALFFAERIRVVFQGREQGCHFLWLPLVTVTTVIFLFFFSQCNADADCTTIGVK